MGCCAPPAVAGLYFRLPVYRFRPAHADPLHFDLWHQGVNLLRDGGSYASTTLLPQISHSSPASLATTPCSLMVLSPCPRLAASSGATGCSAGETPPQLKSTPLPPPCFPHRRHQRQVQVDDGGLRRTIVDTVQISKATRCSAGVCAPEIGD